MEDPNAAQERGAFTPAIVASAIFVAACAVFAISFVGARGGLTLPVAASQRPVAVASAAPSAAVSPVPATPAPSLASMVPPATPTVTPTSAPTASPTPLMTLPPAGTPPPSPFVPPTLEPGDPLLGLDECDGHPRCFEYTVVRGDTLSGIISRYLLDIDVLEALNPGGLSDPSLVVVGQLLYLGRDPLARLDACPDGEACVLYVVQAGESLAEIADRYLTTREAILASNPGMPRPIQPGQVIRLPRA